MIRKSVLLLILVFALVVLAVACNPPAPQPAAQGGLVAWIDAPLDGTTLLLASYEVVFHCSVPSGVAWIELTVDGAILVSNAPLDTTQSLVTTRYVWTPPAPGNYTLRARARDAAGVWSDYATSVVTVEGEVASSTLAVSPTAEPTLPPLATECVPSAAFTGDGSCRAGPAMDHGVVTVFSPGQTVTVDGLDVSGTWWRVLIPGTMDHCWAPVAVVSTTCVGSVSVVEGPTAPAPTAAPTSPAPTAVPTSPTLAPTWTPTPVLAPTVTPLPQAPVIAATQASANIFYSDTKCGVTQLTLQATVDDSDGVTSVTFNYWLKDKTSGAESGWAAIVPMQRVSGTAAHGTWAATLDGSAAIGASSGHEYTLRYYLVATDALGAKTQSPTYENVTLNTRSCVH